MDANALGQITDITVLFAVFVFAGFLFWLGYRWYKVIIQARMQRAESFNRLLERFGSAKEFTDFLQTEQGRKFVADPMPAPRSSSHRILRLIQVGIVLVAMSGGFFLNAYRLRDATDMHYISQASDCQFWGLFALTVGFGLLITSAVTYFLAKHWHLMNGNGQSQH